MKKNDMFQIKCKKTCVLFVFLLSGLSLFAQEYNITFSAGGVANTLDKVLVENVTNGLSLTLNGTDILVLNSTGIISGIKEVQEDNLSKLTLYPNPATNAATLTFEIPRTGNTTISIKDVTGKLISTSVSYLQSGTYSFRMPVLSSGLYIVSVDGKNYRGFEKLLSLSKVSNSSGLIQQITSDIFTPTTGSNRAPQKIATDSIKKALKFTVGDFLRFTGTSGTSSTIIMDSTKASKNIGFYLINCVDADNNAYPVIKIGSLYWMAQNLRTTKTKSRTSLHYINSQLNWNALTSTDQAYCYYNDATDNGDIFGALYTFNAANSTDSITPSGWRLPSDAEFNSLAQHLGGLDIAGATMKAPGTKSWSAPNTNATNSSGFNALASGCRTSAGFSQSGTTAAYWTSTKVDVANGYNALISYNNAALVINNQNKFNDGLAVRCVYEPADTRIVTLQSIFGSNAEPQVPLVCLDTLPIQKKSYFMPSDKELVYLLATDTVPFKLNYNLYRAPVRNIPNIVATGSVMWWKNLKKIATQVNDNGHENTIIAVWNEKVQGFSAGTGQVTLHILGDSLSNFAQQTVVLPDEFTMPDIWAGVGYKITTYNGIGSDNLPASHNSRPNEFAQWEMTLKTGDVNNDGTPDILIAVHDILRIYDGKTFKKIAERSFQSDQGLTSGDKAFSLRMEVADIDKNGKNDIMVTTSSPVSGLSPKLHLFLNGNLASTDNNIHITKDIQFPNKTLKAVNLAIGDINGDNADEIVLSVTTSDKLQYVTYLNYAKKTFTSLASLFQVQNNRLWMSPIILAYLHGSTAPYSIVTGNSITGINAAGKLCFPFTGSNIMISGDATCQVYGDQLVAGNFDKDIAGIDKVCYIRTQWMDSVQFVNELYTRCYLNYMYINNNTVVTVNSPTGFNVNGQGKTTDITGFPAIGGVNTSHTGKILEFVEHKYMLTYPVINAVLATAPYYKDWYTGGNLPSTSWGTSTSVGQGTETEISLSASVIMGFEREFNVPIIGTKIGGVEFTAKVTAGLSSAFSTEKTITKSISYQSADEDAVVVTSTPYDAYFYKIIKSDNPAQEGGEFMISFPRKPITQMISVDSYNKYTEGQDAPVIDKSVLGHTVGEPLTYPSSADGLSNIIGNKQFVITGSEFTGVGNTGGVAKEIEITKTNANSLALSIGYEAELVASVGGVKLGAGYGFNLSNTITTTIGQSTKVGGYVPGVSVNAPSSAPRFNWNLIWYNYRKLNQTFSVVNYLVQGQ